MSTQTLSKRKPMDVRKLTGTAMLAALASVLMFINFVPPLMPSFIKMDFSEMPALLATFAYGPLYGVGVSLIKNLVNLLSTSTGGVGELSNFILSITFIIPAGLIYKRNKSKKGAIIAALVGGILMAIMSVPSNLYVVYPIYTAFMPMEAIIGMYQAILPSVDSLLEALLIFNMPYTFIKAMLNLAIVSLIYKPLSPILHKK